MRKLKLFALCLTMMAGALTSLAWSANGKFPGGGSWMLNESTGVLFINTTVVPNYDAILGATSDWAGNVFPSSTSCNPNGFTVISYGQSPWHSFVDKVKSVEFSSEVTRIGDNAFRGMYALQSVTFDLRSKSDSWVDVGEHAFDDCWSLSSFDFKYVSDINPYAFQRTNFTYVQLPNVSYIGDYAFWGCPGLQRSTIKEAAPTIFISSSKTLYTDDHITTAYGHGKGVTVRILAPYASKAKLSKALPNEDIVFGGQLPASSTASLIYWYVREKTLYITASQGTALPNYSEASKVPWYAARNEIEEIELENINAIGYRNFEGLTALKRFELQQLNVDAIKDNAFNGCTSLETVKIAGIQTIGADAFNGCKGLKFLYLGGNIIELGARAFANCFDGGRISINCDAPKTGTDVFKNVVAEAVTLDIPATSSKSYEKAPWNAFSIQKTVDSYPIKGEGWELISNGTLYISKKDVVNKSYSTADAWPWYNYRDLVTYIDFIDEGDETTVIGMYAFAGMKNINTWIPIPEKCTTIKAHAFDGCTLATEINGTGHVKTIGDNAFTNCTKLQFMLLDACTSMGKGVYKGCTGLKNLYLPKDKPSVTKETFEGITQKDILAHVDQSVLLDYATADIWKNFKFEGPGEHGTILSSGKFLDGYYLFYEDGFLYCYSDGNKQNYGIYDVQTKYGDQVKTLVVEGSFAILNDMFTNLPNLKEAYLPGSLEEIIGSFEGCTGLETVAIDPEGKLYYQSKAFKGCAKLKNIGFKQIYGIGTSAFEGCTALDSAIMPDLEWIHDYAFKGCTGLKKINIGSGKLLGTESFSGCSSLTAVNLNSPYVATSTFENCANLTKVHLGYAVRSVDANAFKGTKVNEIHYIRPFPGEIGTDAFGGLTLSNIKLYAPEFAVEKFKTYDGWKDMQIEKDPDLGDAYKTAVGIGGFVDGTGWWILDENGRLVVLCNGTMTEMPDDGFNMLEIWMPYIQQIAVTGEHVRTLKSMFPTDYYCKDHGGGVKKLYIDKGVEYLGFNFAFNLYYLTDVYCFAEDVPEGDDAFYWYKIKTNGVKLHVLSKPGVKDKYEANAKWSNFTIVADLAEAYYTVTVDAMYGEVEVVEDGIDLNAVPENTTIHLKATPAPGYKFKEWKNYDPATGLTVTSDITVTAVFEADIPTYKVKLEASNGTISVNETVDLNKVPKGTKLTFTATPDEGYKFSSWKNYDEETGLIVTSDTTVTAIFVAAGSSFTVKFIDWDDKVLKTDIVKYGESATAPADPVREGYTFTGWDTDFTNVTKDLDVRATYKKAEEAVENIQIDKSQSVKVLRNGRLYIICGEKTYDATGQEVK